MNSVLLRLFVSAAVCLFGTLSVAAENTAHVTSLMKKDLPNYPGKEGLMISVEYGPGGSDPIHKHDANAFVYVLEGSIVMQVKGERSHLVARRDLLRRSFRHSLRQPQRKQD